MTTFQFDTFRAIASVVLGGVIGFLVGAPASLAFGSTPTFGFTLLFVILGVLVGFKRRKSPAFFYFSLIVACILISVVSFSILS